MMGTISSPQFDADVLHVGKAIHIKNKSSFRKLDVNAIITKFNPLSITVMYLHIAKNDRESTKLCHLEISINDVLSETYSLSDLKEISEHDVVDDINPLSSLEEVR